MSNYEALEYIRKTETQYTQIDVAKKIGCDPKTLRKILKGIKDGEDTNLQMCYVVRLADLYKVSVDFLLGRSPYRHVETEAITGITGLSENAVEVLRYINGLAPGKWDASNIADHNKRAIRAVNELLESIDVGENIRQGREWDGLDPMHSALNTIWFYLHSAEVRVDGLKELDGSLQLMDFNFGSADYDRYVSVGDVYRAYIQKELVQDLDAIAKRIEKRTVEENGKH